MTSRLIMCIYCSNLFTRGDFLSLRTAEATYCLRELKRAKHRWVS
jgi:hypothetical protein